MLAGAQNRKRDPGSQQRKENLQTWKTGIWYLVCGVVSGSEVVLYCEQGLVVWGIGIETRAKKNKRDTIRAATSISKPSRQVF
jgi:hypothetical protein